MEQREQIYLKRLFIPNSYAGDDLQLFISFMNAEETQLSNSIYIGSGTAS